MAAEKRDGEQVVVQKNGWKVVIPIALVIALLPTVLQVFGVGVGGAQSYLELERRVEKVELCVSSLEKCITKVEAAQVYSLEMLREVKESLKELNRKVDHIR